MARIRYSVEIGGRNVDLLYSVTLGLIAEQKGMELVIEDSTDALKTRRFFVQVIWLAAVNAWEYASLGNPSLGELPVTLMDVAEWAELHPDTFAAQVTAAAEAMAGLTKAAKEGAPELKKK